jgi:hypothetical protein
MVIFAPESLVIAAFLQRQKVVDLCNAMRKTLNQPDLEFSSQLLARARRTSLSYALSFIGQGYAALPFPVKYFVDAPIVIRYPLYQDHIRSRPASSESETVQHYNTTARTLGRDGSYSF